MRRTWNTLADTWTSSQLNLCHAVRPVARGMKNEARKCWAWRYPTYIEIHILTYNYNSDNWEIWRDSSNWYMYSISTSSMRCTVHDKVEYTPLCKGMNTTDIKKSRNQTTINQSIWTASRNKCSWFEHRPWGWRVEDAGKGGVGCAGLRPELVERRCPPECRFDRALTGCNSNASNATNSIIFIRNLIWARLDLRLSRHWWCLIFYIFLSIGIDEAERDATWRDEAHQLTMASIEIQLWAIWFTKAANGTYITVIQGCIMWSSRDIVA